MYLYGVAGLVISLAGKSGVFFDEMRMAIAFIFPALMIRGHFSGNV